MHVARFNSSVDVLHVFFLPSFLERQAFGWGGSNFVRVAREGGFTPYFHPEIRYTAKFRVQCAFFYCDIKIAFYAFKLTSNKLSFLSKPQTKLTYK